jgi:hypothetical protein
MRLLRTARLILAAAISAGAGCSLAVDASDIDAGCRDDEKLCSGKCVLIDDPAYGCALEDCLACRLPNAIPKCEDYRCVPRVCLRGFCGADCALNKLTDENNCGECGNACNAGETCEAGSCVAE